MNMHNLRLAAALTLAVAVTGFPAWADEAPNVLHDSGEITWVDLKQGKLQLKNDASVMTGEVEEYRITQNETRVTDPKDEKMMTVNDLWPGQRVKIDVVEGAEEKIVKKIIVEVRPGWELYEAYGRVEAIDAAGTLDLAERPKGGVVEYTDVTHFVFDPKTIVVTEAPSSQPVVLRVVPGDTVKVEFVTKGEKKAVQALTLYSAQVRKTVTTTTVTTTQ